MIKLKYSSLAKFFTSHEMSSKIIGASDAIPFETLFVYLEEEEKDPILQIRITRQELDSSDLDMGYQPNPNGYYHLQFTLPINTVVADKAVGEVGRFIILVNRLSTLPGFEFDEVSRSVYYRYATLVPGKEIDPYLLISITGTILLFITTFESYLKKLAAGEMNFSEVIKEFQQMEELQNITKSKTI